MSVQLGAYREGFAAGRESVMAMLREPSEALLESVLIGYQERRDGRDDRDIDDDLRWCMEAVATAIEASSK